MTFDVRLVKYEQSLSVVDGTGDCWELKTFPGVAPIVVRRDQGLLVVTQAGIATAWRWKFDAPAPIFPTLLERPQIAIKRDGTRKWVTTWTYVSAVAAGTTIDFIAASKYPTTRSFTAVS